ncbi:DUF6686 family protein [Psychroflexus montanilacus]|uniref:DUF6686 family protein n=1 Tax=Psychroflexus montanilacus TaxID=2873598 RepID=UPI001CCCCF7D|nr:DUF6686 family protein [Psychroflexus montanilacus]MBZ9652458.1 hypothetical protein [Psychroflexus montanilacus]
MCEITILYEDSEYLISQCASCQKVCIYFQQIIAGFTKKEFINWHTSFFTSSFESRAYKFPDDQLRVIVDTPYPDLQLTFNESQFNQLKDGLQQSLNFMSITEMIREEV